MYFKLAMFHMFDQHWNENWLGKCLNFIQHQFHSPKYKRPFGIIKYQPSICKQQDYKILINVTISVWMYVNVCIVYVHVL